RKRTLSLASLSISILLLSISPLFIILLFTSLYFYRVLLLWQIVGNFKFLHIPRLFSLYNTILEDNLMLIHPVGPVS
ncbi:hypothetical protein L9F63_009980, partial [Diploptera punctata]